MTILSKDNAFTVKQKCYFRVKATIRMSHFPLTTTTYNLTAEYCTLQRAIQYQQSADLIKSGLKPIFDTRAYEKMIYNCSIQMGLEVLSVLSKGDRYERESFTRLLLSISKDERINNFKVTATFMIEDFNKMFVANQINRNEAYDDFMKDGFVLTDHLLANANYHLKEHFSKEVEVINEAKNIPLNEIMKHSKIKVKLNIDQFAYLIRLMQESDLFEYSLKTDVAKEIIRHFSTIGQDSIGDTSMIKKLSETNKAEAIYWVKLLKKWRDKALAV